LFEALLVDVLPTCSLAPYDLFFVKFESFGADGAIAFDRFPLPWVLLVGSIDSRCGRSILEQLVKFLL
jgi:hypothetical protein